MVASLTAGRVTLSLHPGGHMMYLRKEDIVTANEQLRDFIRKSIPKAGEAAKY